MERGGYVYIMSNANRSTLYIGVTASLYWRVQQHKSLEGSKFTSKYKCVDLLYWEGFTSITEAIYREKQLKKWKRSYKDELIKSLNPDLLDLSSTVVDEI